MAKYIKCHCHCIKTQFQAYKTKVYYTVQHSIKYSIWFCLWDQCVHNFFKLVIKCPPHLLQRCQLRISFCPPIWLSFSLLIAHRKYTVTFHPSNRRERVLPQNVSPLSCCRIHRGSEGYSQLFEPSLNKTGKCNSLKNVYGVHLSLVNPVSTLLCQQIIKRLFSFYFFEFKMKKLSK